MRVEGKGRLEIVLAAFLAAHRLANLMHGANVEQIVPFMLEQLVAKLTDELKATITEAPVCATCRNINFNCKTLLVGKHIEA